MAGSGWAGPNHFPVARLTQSFICACCWRDMGERAARFTLIRSGRELPYRPAPAALVTLATLAIRTSGSAAPLPAGLFCSSALLAPADALTPRYLGWPGVARPRAGAVRSGSPGSPIRLLQFGFGLLGYLLGRPVRGDTLRELPVDDADLSPACSSDTAFAVTDLAPARPMATAGGGGGRPVLVLAFNGRPGGAGGIYRPADDLWLRFPAAAVPDLPPLAALSPGPIRATFFCTTAAPAGIPAAARSVRAGLAHAVRAGANAAIAGTTALSRWAFSALVALDLLSAGPSRVALATAAEAPPSPALTGLVLIVLWVHRATSGACAQVSQPRPQSGATGLIGWTAHHSRGGRARRVPRRGAPLAGWRPAAVPRRQQRAKRTRKKKTSTLFPVTDRRWAQTWGWARAAWRLQLSVADQTDVARDAPVAGPERACRHTRRSVAGRRSPSGRGDPRAGDASPALPTAPALPLPFAEPHDRPVRAQPGRPKCGRRIPVSSLAR